ncbi:MAG: hypothetical protein ACYCWL_03490 [Thauera sp.]
MSPADPSATTPGFARAQATRTRRNPQPSPHILFGAFDHHKLAELAHTAFQRCLDTLERA